ncbi:MAG: SHOCT domain-containing protein [Defluviitaleaceae bacterium]|nr:SHOCT domain-containing protein [Defluviitaleaceae bacterium]
MRRDGGLIGMLFDMHQAQRDAELRQSIREVTAGQTSFVGTAKIPRTPPAKVPLLSTMPPQIKETARPPEDPALAAHMQDLPQALLSVQDAKRVAEKLGHTAKPGLWQNSVVRVIGMLAPDEFVYALSWNAHCVTMQTHSNIKNYFESHGVVVFSDARFVFFKDVSNIIEFPLADIHAVDAHKGAYFDGVSFRTQNLEVKLTFAGKIDRKLFRDMVIHIAADAACPVPVDGAPAAFPQVCECPGCGASVIIHPGAVNKCEYCDRLVEKQIAAPVSQAVSPNVAEELEKYSDLMRSGIISAEEFEEVKRRLISRV